MDDIEAEEAELVPLGDALAAIDAERAAQEFRAEVDRAVLDLERAMGKRDPFSSIAPIDFITATQLLSMDFGETPWLIPGLLTESAVGVIGGEPKTAKTWAALELALAVATGTPAFGEFAPRGLPRGAVCFMVEDSPRSTRNRLRSLVAGRGSVDSGWADRFVVKSLGAMDLSSIIDLAVYVATVRRMPFSPGIVVFDPLRDLHKANEDNSGEMAVVTAALRALRTVLGCAVLFVHHSGKSSEGSAQRRGGQKLRGSSALHGAIDAGLYLTSPSRDRDEAKRSSVYSASAEAEVKAAASAGDFALDLQVFDDHSREAVRAQWVFRRDGDAAVSPTVARSHAAIEQRVLALLHAEDVKAPGGHPPLSKRAILDRLGGKRAAVFDAIQRLAASNRIRVLDGRAGALYQHMPGGVVVGRIGPPPTPPPPNDPDPNYTMPWDGPEES